MMISIEVLAKKAWRRSTGKDRMLSFRAPRPLAAAPNAGRPSRSEPFRRLLGQGAEPAGKERSLRRIFADDDGAG
jgi:hypothetical protein